MLMEHEVDLLDLCMNAQILNDQVGIASHPRKILASQASKS